MAFKTHVSLCFLALSHLFISFDAASAALVDVGSHQLQPNMANQAIMIPITAEQGDPSVRGMNLRVQIGDGNGLEVEPVFQGMLGSFEGLELSGSIWDGLAGGSTLSGNGVPRTGFGSLGSADLTGNNPAESVAADGLLLKLLIDTTGFSTPGSFDLSLSGTALGDTSLIASDGSTFAPLTVTNGTISIVPEPSSMVLGLLATCFLAFQRRRSHK